MLKRYFHWIIISLIFINLFILWYVTHHMQVLDKWSFGDKEDLDLTIVISDYESFDNNIHDTVNSMAKRFQNVKIIIVSSTIPYPYISLPSKNAQFVRTEFDPRQPAYLSDPLHYINSRYVLILPDAIRFTWEITLSDILLKHKKIRKKAKSVSIFPIQSVITECCVIDIDLKIWSLKYVTNEDLLSCDDFREPVAILTEKSILSNLTDPFMKPFYESFFIQLKLRKYNLHLHNKVFFNIGKVLFTDQHFKWKHESGLSENRKLFYKKTGVKYVVNSNGVEKYHGCSKQTPRCFPSVIDVPYYLYDGRWTPPCCLKGLRETARHVFRTFHMMDLKYWLEGGSLLGAARYNDIIPWDYDVDIGMFMNDVTNTSMLREIWEGKKHVDYKGYVWEKAREGDFIRVQYSEVNHLHVDIFPFYEKNYMMTKNTWFKSHRQDREFPSHYLKPLREIYFIGMTVFAPNNHRSFLEFKFGKGVIEKPEYPFPEKLLNKNL